MKKLLFALCMMLPAIALADSDVTAEKASQNTPEGWTAVELPSIPTITDANTYNITSYGASTSAEDNASAIQAAIDAVPSAGGMVVIPAGTWMCGPITVKSKLVLHLAAGATLKLLPYGTYPSDNEYRFPVCDERKRNGAGLHRTGRACSRKDHIGPRAGFC